jgi:hypothetical protein
MQSLRSKIVAVAIAVGFTIAVQLAPAAQAASNDRGRGEIVVGFTKWIVGDGPRLAGFAYGDVVGQFVGEVLETHASTNPAMTNIVSVQAVYQVKAGSHSFTALINGGQNNDKNTAILDGVILNGWHTGSPVRVQFRVRTNCSGAPAGTCFVGTIRISAEDDD